MFVVNHDIKSTEDLLCFLVQSSYILLNINTCKGIVLGLINYLINRLWVGMIVIVLGDFQTIEDVATISNGGDFNRVTRGEEGRPPVVDETFVHDYKTFDIVKFLGAWLTMEGDEIFLIMGKHREV